MTNGEKIKEIFPNSHIDERSHTVWVGYEAMSFRRDWWDAEYKAPTTNNDSPKYCDRSICLKNEYNNVGCEDCEVTKSQEPTTKNDLGVDCVSRQAVFNLPRIKQHNFYGNVIKECVDIEDVRALPSVTPQEPFMNKPCVAHQVCHEDKVKVLEKIRAEIEELPIPFTCAHEMQKWALEIIDKYKTESEET